MATFQYYDYESRLTRPIRPRSPDDTRLAPATTRTHTHSLTRTLAHARVYDPSVYTRSQLRGRKEFIDDLTQISVAL